MDIDDESRAEAMLLIFFWEHRGFWYWENAVFVILALGVASMVLRALLGQQPPWPAGPPLAKCHTRQRATARLGGKHNE